MSVGFSFGYADIHAMRFINSSGNSIYIEDIDLHIPFDESMAEIEVDTDSIKKSASFQKLAILGAFDITFANNSRIEQNIIKMQKEHKEKLSAADILEEENTMESGNAPEVVIKGHFYEAGGYAKVNRNIAIFLAKMGIRVEIQPTTTRHNDLNEVEVGQLRCLTRKLGKDAIRIDSIIPSFSEMSGSRSYRILYTTVESPTIPKQTVDICNAYDEVWVTSDFCRDALRAGGVKREMLVVPSSTNTAMYREDIDPHPFRPPLKQFVFESVFGWSYRKGYDALLRAYLGEFTADDPVSLLIVSRYQYSSDSSKHVKTEIDKYIKTYGGNKPAHIARCNRVIPEHIMPNVYKAGNAFVLPSRGEGFGLPYCEASLCGLPVIATNHSGQTMFLNQDNSYPVDIDRLVKMKPGQMHVHYWDNQLFPDLTSPDFISRLGKKMRHVYENYDEAKAKNKKLQATILKDLSCVAAAKKAKDRIDEIWTSKRRVK